MNGSGKPWLCEGCGYDFPSRRAYQHHKGICPYVDKPPENEGIKPPHMCSGCGRGFVTPQMLLTHICLTPSIAPKNAATGVKHDDGKPRFDLLDVDALEEVAKVMQFGAKKYAAHNWRGGLAVSRLLRAAIGHTFEILRGNDLDEETGLHHAAHAICCLMFVFWTLKHRPDMDDRYFKPTKDTPDDRSQ